MAGMFGKPPALAHRPSMRGAHPGSSFKAPMKGFSVGGAGGGGGMFHYLPGGGMGGGMPAPMGGGMGGMSRGGHVQGGNYQGGGGVPGRGNTDTVPAMLTPGEFVVRKSAAQRHRPLLDKINRSGGGPVGYHEGGPVHSEKKEQTEAHRQHEQRGEYKRGGTVTIGPEHKGQKPVTFKKGGLHRSVGVPEGEKIPASKMAAAKAGKYGPKAKKQASFAQGMLKKGRQTAAANR